MSKTVNYMAKSFGWGVLAKLLDSGIKFFTVSFLIKYFGKEDYGLIALAMSVNAYLQLLDLGVNTGAIKHFSQWIGNKQMDLLDSVARTSITFYGFIGLINSLVLVVVAFFGLSIFNVTMTQQDTLQNMFLVLALFSILNWSTSVFNQVLIANGELYFIQQMNILRTVMSLILVITTVKNGWGVQSYFTGFVIINSINLIPFYFRAKRSKLISSFIPRADWGNFKPLLKYSLAIMAVAIFQMSATNLRPIILSIFSSKGIGVVTEFRIMETITLFVLAIGGITNSIFLPKTSRIVLENDTEKIRRFAYEGTLYTSIISCVLCLPIILCAKEVLSLYVGKEYLYLSHWLSIWLVTILIALHNSPVASLVLATGKTKMLVYSTAIASITSLIINAVLSNYLGVGSAVFGYAIYMTLQILFYYVYFNNKVLNLDSTQIFKSFIIPFMLGASTVIVILILDIQLENLIFQIIIKCISWFAIFVALLFVSKTLSLKKIKLLLNGKNI